MKAKREGIIAQPEVSKKGEVIIEEIREHLELNSDWDEETGPPDYADAYEAAMHECGMSANGQCAYAGTEHCDWDCPFGGC